MRDAARIGDDAEVVVVEEQGEEEVKGYEKLQQLARESRVVAGPNDPPLRAETDEADQEQGARDPVEDVGDQLCI